jgi:hypothetical protein
VIYFIFVVLSAIETCFPEIIIDPKLKQHPKVLNFSSPLPAQSESVYLCSLTSPPKTYLIHVQLYHAGTSTHALLKLNGSVSTLP